MTEAKLAKSALGLVTRRELAAILGVHPITVTKWESAGCPIARRGRRGKPSQYREVEVRAWLQARDEAARQSGPLDPAQERAQRDRWQRMLLEQTHALRARQLLPAEEAEKAWSAEVAAARAKILASYTASADRVLRVATLEGLAGVERELREIAFEILRELSGVGTIPAKRGPGRPRRGEAVA